MNRLHLLANQINESETFPHFTKLSLSQNSSIGYITMRSPKDLNSLGILTLKELN